jgi:hypothetical protein
MEKRKPVFLAETKWLQLPFLFHIKSRKELLQDITLRIPALLFQTDEVISDLSVLHEDHHKHSNLGFKESPTLRAARCLIYELNEVSSELEAWLKGFKETSSTPLWWDKNATGDDFYYTRDPECIPNLEDLRFRLRFPSGQKAALLMQYWSFRLEILTAIIDVQAELLELSKTDDAVLSLSKDLDTHRSMAAEVANMIIQSTSHVLSCLEGRLAARFPLRVVARYKKQQYLQHQGV